jgi:hypothetical protein
LPVTAHVAAGGGPPGSGPFLFGVALLGIGCVALADRRRSAAEITAVVFATQPLLHALLALSSHSPATLSSHGHASVVPSPAMVVAHVIAAAAVTALLIGGEALVWSFAALADTVLLRAARRLLSWLPAGPVYVGSLRRRQRPIRQYTCHSVRFMLRRGPPAAACI